MPQINLNKDNSNDKLNSRLCLRGLQVKEDNGDLMVEGYFATTHPDRVGDILSEASLHQMAGCINDQSKIGDNEGAYRLVSMGHDWIKESDPGKDEVGYVQPKAEVVKMDDGHFGLKGTVKLNSDYNGDMKIDEVQRRIDNGHFAGFSIEYNTDDDHSRTIEHADNSYRFIEELTEFGGIGLAQARKIANPHAVIYKEIAEKQNIKKLENKEEDKMSEEEAPPAEEPVKEEETKEKTDSKPSTLSMKDIEKHVKEQIKKEMKEMNKPILQSDKDTVDIDIKEMNDCLTRSTGLSFKEIYEHGQYMSMKTMGVRYANKHGDHYGKLYEEYGIPLRTTLKVKCIENTHPMGIKGIGKLQIISKLETKATLDTTTNTSAYVVSPVEFSDIFLPGIIETFNNQTNLFGALPKRDNLQGSMYYGWRIKTDQASSLAVDPDSTSVLKDPVDKLKLHTPIREYRIGISVSDYTLFHSRGAIGDLFQIEADRRMADMMRDINNDLFTEQADGAGEKKVVGMEAVADSAGNTALYGITRSAANRLAPAAAEDTYLAYTGPLGTTTVRLGARKIETEGVIRQNIRMIMHPVQRDLLFALEDTKIRYMNEPNLGFFGAPAWDGIPIIVDSSCQEDAMFYTDFESHYIVISSPPQLIGLAKVGAAREAYLSTYLAQIFEQPRRIFMLDTLDT